MMIVNSNTDLVTLVMPEFNEETMSKVRTVSNPLRQPHHFSRSTSNRKAGMAISNIFP
jgi:hypothetical protein